jgi:hypothetical protein
VSPLTRRRRHRGRRPRVRCDGTEGIAALAAGTQTIPAVDKIVGPPTSS